MTNAAQNLFQNILNTENNSIDFDLDNWITDFENGFLDYTKISPSLNQNYWGQGVANRPRIREVNIEGDAQSNQGYRIVEFFPDRDDEKNAYLFFGTPSEIRTQIAVFMNLSRMLKSKDLGTIYGEPSLAFQEERRFHPQVVLHFMQNALDPPGGTPTENAATYRRAHGRISFRVMDETTDSIGVGDATAIATAIKTTFGANEGYIWKKGKLLCAYTDHPKGYGLQLRCRTKSEGKELTTKVLALQNHTPDWSKFTTNENEAEQTAYPDDPPTKLIMGEQRKMPRSRPKVEVRFKFAVLHIHGMEEPVHLYDRTGKLAKPLVI